MNETLDRCDPPDDVFDNAFWAGVRRRAAELVDDGLRRAATQQTETARPRPPTCETVDLQSAASAEMRVLQCAYELIDRDRTSQVVALHDLAVARDLLAQADARYAAMRRIEEAAACVRPAPRSRRWAFVAATVATVATVLIDVVALATLGLGTALSLTLAMVVPAALARVGVAMGRASHALQPVERWRALLPLSVPIGFAAGAVATLLAAHGRGPTVNAIVGMAIVVSTTLPALTARSTCHAERIARRRADRELRRAERSLASAQLAAERCRAEVELVAARRRDAAARLVEDYEAAKHRAIQAHLAWAPGPVAVPEIPDLPWVASARELATAGREREGPGSHPAACE